MWLALLLCTQACRCGGPESRGPAPGDAADPDDSASPADDTGGITTVPGVGGPWLRDARASPGPATFTELHYAPAEEPGLEWLELHNPLSFDLDVSGWTLRGAVDWTAPHGTIVAAGGYLVVAADPELLAAETGFGEALGPYDGRLANDGERLSLHNQVDRLIDSVEWGQDAPWPVGPDGSGFTLAKVRPDAWSDHAEHWTTSAERGGTPGAANGLDPHARPVRTVLVDEDATWTFEASGAAPEAGWAEVDLDDSAWEAGEGPLWAGELDGDALGTAWLTADNYWSLYLGAADGSDLRLVAADSDGSWTSVGEVDLELTSTDHLYVAAWELTGDSWSTQMLIAEVELDHDTVGTEVSGWEWVLGPSGDNPGGLPGSPPAEGDVQAVVEEAEDAGDWAAPAVEQPKGSSPWGSSVGSSFVDAAFVWADTFDADSVTNQEDTWALFRTTAPLAGPAGNIELDAVPTTLYLRTAFPFEGRPDRTRLELDCEVDDGVIVYLNGVEVLRWNMPEGEVDEGTLATDEIDGDGAFVEELDAGALVAGDNLLAVELHQAAEPDLDLFFACTLVAETSAEAPSPPVVLGEVPGVEDLDWIELLNVSEETQHTDELVLLTSTGETLALPAASLDPGELFLVEDLDLDLEAGDRLFLQTADGLSQLDAVRLTEAGQARLEPGGPWLRPTEATPGAANAVDLEEDVVISEIMVHRAPRSEAGQPFTERDEEWIELFNRGEVAVDLGGWQLSDAVAFTLPEGTTLAPGAYLVLARDAEALQAAHPSVTVLGDWEGTLSNSTDHIVLRDAKGNPADAVRYWDGGRWPAAADGGGSSLELRDPWADNAVAEAWAASDELPRSAWTEVLIRGQAGSSAVGPDGQWEELVLGLLDAGEVLVDDLRVVRDPDGAAVDVLQNGSFEDTRAWRLRGSHRHSEVVADPEDPGEGVLRLVATGPTGHMHDLAETTLTEDIDGSETYEISFRARWVSGSNQLHSRLYFNRLPTTTLLPQPETSGTPGAANSRATGNLGPTSRELTIDPVVPEATEPVLVSLDLSDPDGVEEVLLWSSRDGGAWVDQAMSETSPGTWTAELAGDVAGTVIQLYVEATDGAGASAFVPAAGPDSRALFAVDDGEQSTTGLHDLRLLMTPEDLAWLHEEVNLMSNDLLGASVVYNESEWYPDVGVRLKGSQRGRPSSVRLGYGLRFRDDQPFRGSHTGVMIDRSEGVSFGQREVLLNIAATGAGLVSAEYNDLVHLIAPDATYTGSAELQLDRFSNLVLDAQFDEGSEGTRYEYELVYYPTTTDDGTPEGDKLPQPDTVTGASLTSLGDSKEDHRWIWLIKNNARRDDYDGLMGVLEAMDQPEADWLAEADARIDVDQWLRGLAFATLSGAVDQLAAGSAHNAQFYVRPADGRLLYFPHDLDYFGSATMSVVGSSDLSRLLAEPAWQRSYYGHLHDIIERAYNAEYLGRWCEQLSALLPTQDLGSRCDFVEDRVAYVQSGSSSSIQQVLPEVDFALDTNGGEDFETDDTEVDLEGTAWIDVRTITRDGEALPLQWLDARTWRVAVELEEGDNDVVLVALDLWGAEVGRDEVRIVVGGS